MAFKHIITHGLFYAVIGNGYLFLVMVTTSPRVWGYNDYPEVIKKKVPPQTKKEKLTAAIWGVPWIIFGIAFPFISTYILKAGLGGIIPFYLAFFNVFVMIHLLVLGDIVVLDWLIISRITPRYVIIPGSGIEDYKDFSHHYKSHAKAEIKLIPACLIIAAIVTYV
jgi:hypothetical protein